MWNFHGYIAIPLEEYGRKYIGSSASTADEIENGDFIYAMLQILMIKNNTLKNNSDFLARCNQYSKLTEPLEKEKCAKEIFEDFKRLIK